MLINIGLWTTPTSSGTSADDLRDTANPFINQVIKVRSATRSGPAAGHADLRDHGRRDPRSSAAIYYLVRPRPEAARRSPTASHDARLDPRRTGRRRVGDRRAVDSAASARCEPTTEVLPRRAPRRARARDAARPRAGRPRADVHGPVGRDHEPQLPRRRRRHGRARYVVRLAGNDTHLLGISREVEHAATVAAAGVGVGPEVIAFVRPEGYLVTRFIVGPPVSDEAVHRPETIRRVADSLRRIHDGPAIPGLFVPFRIVEAYRALAIARGVPIPPEYDLATAIARRIELARS